MSISEVIRKVTTAVGRLFYLGQSEFLDYVKQPSFNQELRRLRTLGFIENCPGRPIGSMANQGNLRDYVRLTERGKEYLKLIERLEQKEPTT